jgi:NAD-dependent deacetylase
VWTRRQPVYFDEFLASEEKRTLYWDHKAEGWDAFRTARPNDAHRAVAKIDALGRLGAVVTQNIDGLHQAAGLAAEKVVELHGTNRFVECLTCGRLSDPDPWVAWFRANRRSPRCDCGGWLKFATISFGQALKVEVLERAAREAERADLVLALGSTLAVYPAASIPLVALRAGAPYVIVNQGPTEHDGLATLRIEADVVAVLPPAVAALADS